MSEKFNKFKDNLKAFFTAENLKKVFTVKNIIIMVLAVALIVGTICALVSANKARKEAEANADSLQGQLDDLKNQMIGNFRKNKPFLGIFRKQYFCIGKEILNRIGEDQSQGRSHIFRFNFGF